MCSIVDNENGIEYFTNINPITGVSKKDLQDQYITEYKIATHVFYNELMVSKDIVKEQINNNNVYDLVVDCSPGNDEIQTGTNYGVKFLKSVFLSDKQKDVMRFLKEYYDEFLVSQPHIKVVNETTKKVVFLISQK